MPTTLTQAVQDAVNAIRQVNDTMRYEGCDAVTALEGEQIQRMFDTLYSVLDPLQAALTPGEATNPDELLRDALRALNTAPSFRYDDSTSYKLAAKLSSYFAGKVQAEEADHIIIRWHSEDVQEVRPDLTAPQAMQVLQRVKHCHDCNYGVTWDTLRAVADELFPEAAD